MALYSYQALTNTGKKVSGSVDAPSLAAAREAVGRMGMFPIKIEPLAEGRVGFNWRDFFKRKVSVKDKIFFTKQLSILLKSGVPLLDALDLLAEQTEGSLKNVVIALRDNIKEGKSLADGMSRYPKIFENIYVQLVRAGEASGRLEVILDRLTNYLERKQELNKKIRNSMTYPIIQLLVIGAVVVILMTFVVPQIAEVFEGQGQKLPWNTRLLLSLSHLVTDHYIALLGTIVGSIISFIAWRSTAIGARQWDALKLHLPLIKYFARMNAVVQFSSTLGMLIEAGVNLAESLTIVVNIIDNRVLVDALNAAKENIIKQGRVAEYLKQTGIFPPMAIYLINTGEQSGHLDTMLLTVARTYETELKDLADSLAGKIEPIMMMVMAVIVGFIVFSVMGPIMQLTQTFGQTYT